MDLPTARNPTKAYTVVSAPLRIASNWFKYGTRHTLYRVLQDVILSMFVQ